MKSTRDWSSDVCSSDLGALKVRLQAPALESRANEALIDFLARLSRAGACNRTFNAPPISPATSSLLARGCTRTGKKIGRATCREKQDSAYEERRVEHQD